MSTFCQTSRILYKSIPHNSQWMLWAVPIPCCALPPPQVYGIFYATSFLELYRSPHNSTTSAHNATVLVQRDEQYLFLVGSPPPLPSAHPWPRQDTALTSVPPSQVRVVSPYQGPPSDYVVVKMIPDNRLPPRHLHAVRTGKTFAVIKWESPYDSPDQDMVTPHRAFSWPCAHKILPQTQILAFLPLEKA